MKKKVILLFAIFSMCGFVACSSENNENNTSNVGAGSDTEVVTENMATGVIDEPIVEVTVEPVEPTEESVSEETEATAEPALTEAPVVEATPEPTEVPELYPGIDMESDLPGEEWVATFMGVLEEPKVVIYNDETGRKEIVEEGSTVTFNPDKDTFVLYLPEGWKDANKSMGLRIALSLPMEFGKIWELDAEKIRESKFKKIKVYTKNDNDEEKVIEFTMKTE